MSDEEEEEEEAEICSLVALNLDNGVEVSKMSSNTAFLVKWYVRTVLKHLPNNHNSLSENIFLQNQDKQIPRLCSNQVYHEFVNILKIGRRVGQKKIGDIEGLFDNRVTQFQMF